MLDRLWNLSPNLIRSVAVRWSGPQDACQRIEGLHKRTTNRSALIIQLRNVQSVFAAGRVSLRFGLTCFG